jgi:hypothetical protein
MALSALCKIPGKVQVELILFRYRIAPCQHVLLVGNALLGQSSERARKRCIGELLALIKNKYDVVTRSISLIRRAFFGGSRY